MRRTRLLAMVLVGLSTALISDTSYAQNRACGSNGRFRRLEVVGLTTDQRLICFRETRADRARDIGAITGLNAGEMLVGIDYRPANGMLYGLGTLGGVYMLTDSGVATRVSTLVDANGAAVALAGQSFGVDFNPVPDRLRVISDTGQNLRVNVDTGLTLVDGALNLTPGTATLGVTAAGYSNNDAEAGTNTVLHVLNTTADQLTIQAPPNAGTLNPVGALTVDSGLDASLDVFSLIENGTTRAIRALATLPTTAADGSVSVGVYGVNLASGRVVLRSTFAATNRVIGIAIPLTQGRGNN